ncbi:MAG: 2-oxoacid:ferredoxin oxidoreductase subunit beta [Bdellovibrionaceae bacterium]|nr:2-oxoacid:ferredoxin oxidoreductase subunit beta [Pseudobdellovibrionaceae bacterium]
MSKIKKVFNNEDYKGSPSTLCTGCGHNSISEHILNACYDLNIAPNQIVKLSGIGCSSKSINYFLNQSFGINFIHGRMPPLATGVYLANPDLKLIGISGDGDTANIGLSSFCHLLRRNIPMVYIVENNSVYGLTKGQLSATAYAGHINKSKDVMTDSSIDLCTLAIEMGCQFVARSFSGDKKQMQSLIKLALQHNGTAFIDVISPCIAFANNPESKTSHVASKKNRLNLNNIDLVNEKEETPSDTLYKEGDVLKIAISKDTTVHLYKLESNSHDLTKPIDALSVLNAVKQKNKIATGLFHFVPSVLKKPVTPDKSKLFIRTEAKKLSADQLKSLLNNFKQ